MCTNEAGVGAETEADSWLGTEPDYVGLLSLISLRSRPEPKLMFSSLSHRGTPVTFVSFVPCYLFSWFTQSFCWSPTIDGFLREGKVNLPRPCMTKNTFILPSNLIDSLAGY